MQELLLAHTMSIETLKKRSDATILGLLKRNVLDITWSCSIYGIHPS
jgi:hypothetical protein